MNGAELVADELERILVLTATVAAELRARAAVLRQRKWVRGMPVRPGMSCALVDCDVWRNTQRTRTALSTPAMVALRQHLGVDSIPAWNYEQSGVNAVADAMMECAARLDRSAKLEAVPA